MIDLGLLVTDNDLRASVADDFECMQMIEDDMFPINGGYKTKHGITCLMPGHGCGTTDGYCNHCVP